MHAVYLGAVSLGAEILSEVMATATLKHPSRFLSVLEIRSVIGNTALAKSTLFLSCVDDSEVSEDIDVELCWC
jgi:hypothetical protein